MILTFTPNPAVDKTVFVDELDIGTFMRAPRYTCIAGGKGVNVSRTIKTLRAPTHAMLIVGGHTGRQVVEMIEESDGIETIPVWVESPTRTITTVLETSIHRQTAFFEPGSRVTEKEAQEVKDAFVKALDDASLVTLNGTVPDPAIRSLHRELLRETKKRDVRTILDSHGPEFVEAMDEAPFMIKPNLKEAQEALGCSIKTDAERMQAIDAFHRRGIELVVLSLGKEGALISNGTERFQAMPPPIEEVNAVGSGDALVGGFAVGLYRGLSLEETAALGVAAGCVNAMSWDIGHYRQGDVEELKPRVKIKKMSG